MGERSVRNAEVEGSIPFGSTAFYISHNRRNSIMPAKKKETAAKAPAARKAKVVNTSAVKASVVLQYSDKSVTYDELTERVKQIWTKDLGKKIVDIDTLDLYIKPEENKVYFVVNNEPVGDFDL